MQFGRQSQPESVRNAVSITTRVYPRGQATRWRRCVGIRVLVAIRAPRGRAAWWPVGSSSRRDSKNDSIWGARREMQRRIPPYTEPAWALQPAKAIGQKCEKPEQPRELKVESRAVLRTGQEPNNQQILSENRSSKTRRRKIRRAQLHLLVLKLHPEKMRLSRVAERTSIT
jgi:hypothetical protein